MKFSLVLFLLLGQMLAESPIVPSTPMEAALEELRNRFPDKIVIGFEELPEVRPDVQPRVALGPADATLTEVLQQIRKANPNYKLVLHSSGLLHVYSAARNADPVRLLDVRVSNFVVPPTNCIQQQISNMDSAVAFYSYTPELRRLLLQKKQDWYRIHERTLPGVVGDFLGDCQPEQHGERPVYRNVTVREALNLMALASLRSNSSKGKKPVCWKYFFRREPTADTGLGGYPVFQTF